MHFCFFGRGTKPLQIITMAWSKFLAFLKLPAFRVRLIAQRWRSRALSLGARSSTTTIFIMAILYMLRYALNANPIRLGGLGISYQKLMFLSCPITFNNVLYLQPQPLTKGGGWQCQNVVFIAKSTFIYLTVAAAITLRCLFQSPPQRPSPLNCFQAVIAKFNRKWASAYREKACGIVCSRTPFL